MRGWLRPGDVGRWVRSFNFSWIYYQKVWGWSLIIVDILIKKRGKPVIVGLLGVVSSAALGGKLPKCTDKSLLFYQGVYSNLPASMLKVKKLCVLLWSRLSTTSTISWILLCYREIYDGWGDTPLLLIRPLHYLHRWFGYTNQKILTSVGLEPTTSK